MPTRGPGPGRTPWLSRHADPARLFLAGDNIAHNVALRAGREGLGDGGAAATTIRGLALLDPHFWGKRPVPSETTDEDTRRWHERTWSFVCGGRYGIDDPVINPVAMPREEWRRLPCTRVLVTVAGLDMLSARGRAYVHALRASGWPGEAELYETPGEYHVYFLNKPDRETLPETGDLPSAEALPSVFYRALGKDHVCRVPNKIHSANKNTRQNTSLPSVFFWHSAKKLFAVCIFFPSANHFFEAIFEALNEFK